MATQTQTFDLNQSIMDLNETKPELIKDIKRGFHGLVKFTNATTDYCTDMVIIEHAEMINDVPEKTMKTYIALKSRRRW